MFAQHIKYLFQFSHTFSSDGYKLHSLAGDEIQSFVDVGNFVESKMSKITTRGAKVAFDCCSFCQYMKKRLFHKRNRYFKFRWVSGTASIFSHLIFPRSGLGRVSPEMTSSNNMSFRPFLKSSSIFSICVPAFLRWELTHAVKVWKGENDKY